ncbi:ChbG/HpnK family deacetylase [Bavariicoccus seileri]|uniref:ChbG/HpnK family deacetylase n=1 Tax=Bavariicoccus seileri TaxID=549685 RepID=UPI003F90F875
MSRKKFLIIDADDFGLTEGVSKGIVQAIDRGVVTETNLIATSPFSQQAIELAKKEHLIRMGIHLTLNVGKPLFYTDTFVKLSEQEKNKSYYDIVFNEFKQQIEFLLSSGLELTHLTYHKNIIDDEGMATIIANLALQYQVPVRNLVDPRLNDVLKERDVVAAGTKLINPPNQPYTLELVKELLSSSVSEVSELICHPGLVDSELRAISSLTDRREEELSLFTSKAFKGMIEEMGYTLSDYSILKTR